MGGGKPCRHPFVARMSQARRKHGAGTRRGTCPSARRGACLLAPVVALPTLRSHPRWSPRWGLHGACSLRARSCGPSRTLSPLPRPSYPACAPPGGRRCVCGGGGGRPCRRPFVARMSQARRRVGFRTRTAHGTTHGNYPLLCPLCSLPRPLCSLGAEQSPCLPRRSLPLRRLSGLRSPPKCPTSFALPVPSSLVLAGPRCMILRRHTAHCTFGGGLPCGSTPRHPALPSAPVRCGRLARLWGTLLPPSLLCHL